MGDAIKFWLAKEISDLIILFVVIGLIILIPILLTVCLEIKNKIASIKTREQYHEGKENDETTH